MKNKKILIISITIIIIIFITILIMYKFKSSNLIEIAENIQDENIINNNEQISVDENIKEDIKYDENKENVVINDVQVNTFKDEKTEENTIKINEPIVKNQTVSKQENNNVQEYKNNSIVTEIQNIEKKETEEIEISDKIEQQIPTENKTEVVNTKNNENTQQERVTTAKRNDTYIQKIKNYLETHESTDMKKYGYEIIVDSSIINLTNGFTYSEFNMSPYTKTAGKIRIYAEDIYINGEFMQTLCYVL